MYKIPPPLNRSIGPRAMVLQYLSGMNQASHWDRRKFLRCKQGAQCILITKHMCIPLDGRFRLLLKIALSNDKALPCMKKAFVMTGNANDRSVQRPRQRSGRLQVPRATPMR